MVAASTPGFPSLEQLFLDEPLYRPLVLPNPGGEQILDELRNATCSLRAYCIQCGEESVFQAARQRPLTTAARFSTTAARSAPAQFVMPSTVMPPEGAQPSFPESEIVREPQPVDEFFVAVFRCAKVSAHHIAFAFAVHDGTIQKIGQFPSLSDFEASTSKRYRKGLGKELGADYTRAINLHAHDVGAGSFVYLRRIFESLLDDARAKAAERPDWNEDDYRRLRITERIMLLGEFLPPFMVTNAKVYSILSRGVHELSEQECLAHFAVVKGAIDLILDQVLAERESKRRQAEIGRALNQIAAQSRTDDD